MWYYLGLICSISRGYFKLYNYNKAEIITTILLIICLLIDLYFSRIEIKYYILLGIITLLGIININLSIIFTFAFIILSKNKNKNKIMEVVFRTNVLFYILTIIFYYVGYSENYELSRKYIKILDGVLSYRETLGFNHPNTAVKFFIPIFISYIYLNRNVLNLKKYIGLSLVIALLYLKTFSRTFIYSLIVSFIFIFIIKKIKILKKMSRYYIVIVSVLSYFLGVNANNLREYNNIVSGRFNLWGKYLNLYNLSILGQKIPNDIKEYYPLDNSYLTILLNQGLLILTVYIFFYCIYMKKIKDNYIMVGLVVIILTVGFFESYIFLFTINPLVLIMYSKTRFK